MISVEVSPRELEGKETGLALATFGPVSMSPQVRCELAEIARNGKYVVQGVNAETSEKVVVELDKDELKVVTGKEGKVTSFPLTCTSPTLSIDEMNPKSVHLAPSDLTLSLSSRHQRELCVFALRYFQQLVYSLTPAHTQFQIYQTYINEAGFQFLAHFDIGLELAQIRRELFLSIDANDQLHTENKALRRQIAEMEREMAETLTAYKAMVEDNDTAEQLNRVKMELNETNLENEKLANVVKKLEKRVLILQETNNSYKGRLVDLQEQLEEALIYKETEVLSRSYSLEAQEPIPNSPRCSKIMPSNSVSTARKGESVRVNRLESELNKLKTEHRTVISQLKDRYEARCSALRKVIEIQQKQVSEDRAKSVLQSPISQDKFSVPETDLSNQPSPAPDLDQKLTVTVEENQPSVSDSVPDLPLQVSLLQERIESLEKDKEDLQNRLNFESLEREKYQRETDQLSAKLSRAEAQVRKAQRQLSVNTG